MVVIALQPFVYNETRENVPQNLQINTTNLLVCKMRKHSPNYNKHTGFTNPASLDRW